MAICAHNSEPGMVVRSAPRQREPTVPAFRGLLDKFVTSSSSNLMLLCKNSGPQMGEQHLFSILESHATPQGNGIFLCSQSKKGKYFNYNEYNSLLQDKGLWVL